MPFTPKEDQVQWFAGANVEAEKAKMRQTDLTFMIRLLNDALTSDDCLKKEAKQAQAICEQAKTVVDTGNVDPDGVIKCGDASIWTGFTQQGTSEFCLNVRALAGLTIFEGAILINPLAFGDFNRAFADLFNEKIKDDNSPMKPYGEMMKGLQNAQAFDKTTNRIRIKRRDILDQSPGVGITQWYLPSDDVLGTIDRLIGYYETGDISGSTTDGLAAMALVSSINNNKIGTVADVEKGIVTFVNNGLALAAMAGMVVQMHHSLPECMMAINLMPRTMAGEEITQVYSPFLTNIEFTKISGFYKDWQQARFNILGGEGVRADGAGRMLILLQDIFQMPNRANETNEVALIVPFEYEANADTSKNPSYFGIEFYNNVVDKLNTSNPGPAITLEKLSKAAFALWFEMKPFNPEIDDPPLGDKIWERVNSGMDLRKDTLKDAKKYEDLIKPFIEVTEYGKIKDAEFA